MQNQLAQVRNINLIFYRYTLFTYYPLLITTATWRTQDKTEKMPYFNMTTNVPEKDIPGGFITELSNLVCEEADRTQIKQVRLKLETDIYSWSPRARLFIRLNWSN